MNIRHILLLLIVISVILCLSGFGSAGLVPTLTLPNSHAHTGAPNSLSYIGHVQAPVQVSGSCTSCSGENDTGSASDLIESGSDKISKSAELAKIDSINAIIKKNGLEWTAGETSVSRLTPEAYQRLLGYNASMMGHDPEHEKSAISPSVKSIPRAFSWRNYQGRDWTTPVRDQGGCGSCWAFAEMGMFESYMEINKHRSTWNPNFAEQYLLSCNTDGSSCAGGGWASLNHLIRTKDVRGGVGTVMESKYQYVARKTACKSLSGYPRYKVPNTVGGVKTNWYYMGGKQSIETLKQLIYGFGPIAVSMCTDEYFQYYKGGIFSDPIYHTQLNGHAVVLVGWGQGPRGLYWILKNSWGPGWGEKGWMRIYAGSGNVGSNLAFISPGPLYTGSAKSASNQTLPGHGA